MVNLELGHFLVLVGRHPDELALVEHVGAEGGVGQLEDVAGAHQVEPRLVLVHRVQDRLQERGGSYRIYHIKVWNPKGALFTQVGKYLCVS